MRLPATSAIGWDTLPGSALRSLTGEKMRLPATSAIGWDTLPGSALVSTAMMVGGRRESMEEVPNATSATGLVISPVSAMRKEREYGGGSKCYKCNRFGHFA